MNTVVTVGVIMTMAFLAVQGCSAESRSSAKEFGNDLKRDVNKTASDVDQKVGDALD